MRDYEEKSYYEIQLDNKQLILVFLAGMTVCVLIFVLGIMVGKGKKEAEMAAMKNEATTTAAASPDVTPPQEVQPATDADDRQKERKNRKAEKEEGDTKSSDKYAFYGLDKTDAQQPLTKEPVPDTTQKKTTKEADKIESDSKAKSDTKDKKETDVKKVEETPKVAKETVKQEPIVEQVRTSLPDTTEEVTSETTDESGRYTVQVMATASRNKADEQLQFLKAKGYTAFMHTDEIQGGSVYKVRVGKFSDPSSAKKTATRIKQDLKLETWVAVLD